MLASITPLGERSRDNHYWLTASAFVLGAAVTGTLLGGALGLLGSVAPAIGAGTMAIAACLAVVALLMDARLLPLPTYRRQVDAMWIDTYRGTVYGFGFGAQLGFAVATIVTSALTYLWMTLAVLLGSLESGALLGFTFGIARGLAILPAARVTSNERFGRLAAGLARWEPSGRSAGLVAELAFAGAIVVWFILR